MSDWEKRFSARCSLDKLKKKLEIRCLKSDITEIKRDASLAIALKQLT